jgi:hypothetical protein
VLNIKISLKVHKLYVELKLLSKATERRREAEEEEAKIWKLPFQFHFCFLCHGVQQLEDQWL